MPTGAFAENGALCYRQDGQLLKIAPYGPHSLRVVGLLDGLPGAPPEAQALLPVEEIAGQIEIGPSEAIISNGRLEARIDLSLDSGNRTGGLSFYNLETKELLLREKPPYGFGPLTGRQITHSRPGLVRLEQIFEAREGEKIFGLGQHHNGLLDQKGCVLDLAQHNSDVAIPFFISSLGYGFLWNTPAVTRVELAANHTRFSAEEAFQLDYWICASQNPAELMQIYGLVTGYPPKFPGWASGFWQSKLRYRNQDELLEVARQYRKRKLPLSVLVIDYFHWTRMGDWKFDPREWPDPAAMQKELRDLGVETVVSVWPAVNPLSENYAEMLQNGYLIRTEKGTHMMRPYADKGTDGGVYISFFDATHPDAGRFVWEKIRRNYLTHGIKTFWLDGNEPPVYPRDFANLRFYLGSGGAMLNIYPLCQGKLFWEGLREQGVQEPLTLCRSAWAGSQRYGMAVWSGDIPSTFESLANQIRSGQNMAMSGIPWWTTDMGGFHGGDPEDPQFRELLVRWFQFGLFCPIFRLHGMRLPVEQVSGVPMSGADNEVWSFGEETLQALKPIMQMREALRPYIHQRMNMATTTGEPLLRPLFFDFPEDHEAWTRPDQFMFGPDYLVAPIERYLQREREVYLPAGTWRHGFTGETYQGPCRVSMEAPLAQVPFFIRGNGFNPVEGADSD